MCVGSVTGWSNLFLEASLVGFLVWHTLKPPMIRIVFSKSINYFRKCAALNRGLSCERYIVQIVNKGDFHKLDEGLTDLVVADGVCSSHKHQHLSLGPFLPQDFQTSSFRVQPGHRLKCCLSESVDLEY